MLRDHYEGTPYDLTQGLSSGPHGDPARWDMADTTNAGYASADTTSLVEATSGKFERAISIFRASYSFVSQSRGATSDLPSVLWVGQYAPHSTSYVPLYVASDALPEAFSTGSLHDVDHTSQYWASALVGNWAGRLYDITYPLVQRHIEDMAEEIHARRSTRRSSLLSRTRLPSMCGRRGGRCSGTCVARSRTASGSMIGMPKNSSRPRSSTLENGWTPSVFSRTAGA